MMDPQWVTVVQAIPPFIIEAFNNLLTGYHAV